MTEINEKKLEEEKLATFQAEIAAIKADELSGKIKTAHLYEVNPEELTPEDAIMWGKVKDGSITQDDVSLYQATMLDGKRKLRNGITRSRYEFLAFIINKSVVFLLGRQLDEEERGK